ncbi:hypothetical protein CASFOL_013916 [Castilleja foliolosa]|uniref:Uncharacterized protein n=1 Tax=Castilleja foliolosa TaxID=1961234 RepID=A0ABD3DLE5_9LAMI
MMFESSQYDSAAGVGFVSSQLADPTPASAKSRDSQPIYPATVKQIIQATPSTDDKSTFLIDGVDVYNVKLVGMVFNKSERVTDVSFTIDDGTGRIGCNKWVNDPHDTKEVEGLIDGVYIRIHGHLKISQGKKQVVVYAIRPVSDYNEIANHFIECVHAHCCNSRLQNNGSALPSAPSSVTTPGAYQAGSSSQISQEYNLDGLGSIDKMVLDLLQLPSSLAQEKGVHRNEIAQKLKISQEKIIEAMESLESEGLVYSTIDEFHYKSTAS